jgi:hypothetical protein
MHEMGIANSVLEAVHKELHQYPQHRVVKIGLRIGEYAGVDCESLRFCFEAITKQTEFENVGLSLEFCEGSDALDIAFIELDDTPGLTARAVVTQKSETAPSVKTGSALEIEHGTCCS